MRKAGCDLPETKEFGSHYTELGVERTHFETRKIQSRYFGFLVQ